MSWSIYPASGDGLALPNSRFVCGIGKSWWVIQSHPSATLRTIIKPGEDSTA
jgi:hypothetical protein